MTTTSTTFNQAAEKWRLAVVTGDQKAVAKWKAEMDRLSAAFKVEEAGREIGVREAFAPVAGLEPQEQLGQRQRIAFEELQAAQARGDLDAAQRWAREVAVFTQRPPTPEGVTRLLERRGFPIEGVADIAPQILMPGESTIWTPDFAAQYDIALPEGYSLEVISNPEIEGGFEFITITPEGWRITQDGIYMSPEGEEFTLEQMEEIWARAEEIEETLGQLFPDQDVAEVAQYAEANPEQFLADIAEIGPTPETKMLLRQLGMTEAEVAEMLAPAFVPAKPLKLMPVGFYRITDQPWSQVLEFARKDPLGIQQAILFEGRTPATEALVISLYAGQITDDEKFLNEFFLEDLPGRFIRGTFLPEPLQDYWKLYFAGVGDLAQGFAGLADRVGVDAVAQTLKNIAAAGHLAAVDVDMGKPDTPGWYAKNLMRMVPMLLTLLVPGLGAARGAIAISRAAGAGGFLSRVIGVIAGNAVFSTGEGILEAGAGYNEAKRRGFSQAEMNTVFDKILRENIGLLSLSNMAQFGAAFLLPGGSTGRMILKGLGFGFGAATEGFEEVAQLGITRSALGDEVLVFDDEFWQNFKLGMAGGLLFQGVITAYAGIQNRTLGRMTPEQKDTMRQDVAEGQLGGLPRQEAIVVALDKFAETSEGEAIVTEVVEEIMAEEKAEAIPDIARVEEAIQPIVDQVQPITTRADELVSERAPAAIPEVMRGKTTARVELSFKSIDELNTLREKIEADPANQMPEGGFYKFTPKARKQLSDIAWAVTNKLAREAEPPAIPQAELGLPEGYRINEVAGQFDIYRPDGKLAGTRTTREAAIKYAQTYEAEFKLAIPKPELPLELTPAEFEANLAIPGSPEMGLDQAAQALELFGRYIESTTAQDAWALTKQLRRETLAQRAENLKARAQEFIIEQGIPAEEAMEQAIRQTMAGELPSVRIDAITDMTQELRDALFAKVYHTLQAEPLEMAATVEALTNALLGKPIPRKPGVKGGSAFTRLQRVFGDQPAVLRAIDTAAREGRTLPEIVEGVFRDVVEGGIPPTPLDQEMVAFLSALSDKPFKTPTFADLLAPDFPFPHVEALDNPSALQYAKAKMALAQDLATGKIDKITYDRELLTARNQAFPPPPLPPFEPPIKKAFDQYPLMPMFEKKPLVRVLKELAWSPVDIGNLLRATKATLDNSFLRQAKVLAGGHPRVAWHGHTKSYQAMFSQKTAEASWETITRDPVFELYAEIKEITGHDPLRTPSFAAVKGTARWETAEEFGFPTVERLIPRITSRLPHIKPFERAFVTGLNTIVWDIWTAELKYNMQYSERIASGEIKLKEGEGFSIIQEMTAMQSFLADAVQRGTLPKAARSMAPVFNAFFFAARSKLGRFLLPRHLVSRNARVRKQAWRTFVLTHSIIAGIMLLGDWLELWETETDPRNAEVMSARIGNTRIDPWAGYRQFAVLYARLVTGTGISSVSGAEYEIDKLGALETFWRNSLAPLPSILLDFWTGRNFLGQAIEITNAEEWVKRLGPFLIEDIWEAFEDGGWGRAGISLIPAWYGEGVQTYSGDWGENFTKLGLPKYVENLIYGLDEPVYDVKDFWADTASRFSGVDPTTLTEEKGFPPYIKALVEAARVKEELSLIPNQSLASLNADPAQGTTFGQYYLMWQERLKIVASGDEEALKAFDADERTRNAHLGNMTQRQYALLAQYHSLDEAEQAKFLEEHPELGVNARDEWLKQNPEENAKLAIWGQEAVLTQEAYDIARRLIEQFDIPDSAVAEYLPPKELAEPYFERIDIVEKWGSGSWEDKLFRGNNPELNEWLGLAPIDDNMIVLEIKVKGRELFDLWDAYGERGSPSYIEDKDARAEARDRLEADNPDWAGDRQRVIAYGLGVPEDLIEKYVTYNSMPRKGYAQERFLKNNPDYYEDVWKAILGNDSIDFAKVPTEQVERWWNQYEAAIDPQTGRGDSDARMRLRCASGDFDAWLHIAKGFKPAFGTDRCQGVGPPPPFTEAPPSGVQPPVGEPTPEFEFELPPFTPVPQPEAPTGGAGIPEGFESKRWWLEDIDGSLGQNSGLHPSAQMSLLSKTLSDILKGIFPDEQTRLQLIQWSRQEVDNVLADTQLTEKERDTVASMLAEAHDFLEDLPFMTKDEHLAVPPGIQRQ